MTAFSRRQREFLAALTEAGVRFVVIGGRALHVHGGTRRSDDLDLLIAQDGDNPDNVLAVIECMSGQIPSCDVDVLRHRAIVLHLKEVDVLTSIKGVDFDAVYEASVGAEVGGTWVRVMGIRDLIRAKEVSRDANEAPEAKCRDERDLETLRSLLQEM